MFLHWVEGLGANLPWPKPLEALAVIDPAVPFVVSLTTAWRPLDVSCRVTLNVSPWLRNYTLCGYGVPEASAWNCTGFGGPCGLPVCGGVRLEEHTAELP